MAPSRQKKGKISRFIFRIKDRKRDIEKNRNL